MSNFHDHTQYPQALSQNESSLLKSATNAKVEDVTVAKASPNDNEISENIVCHLQNLAKVELLDEIHANIAPKNLF